MYDLSICGNEGRGVVVKFKLSYNVYFEGLVGRANLKKGDGAVLSLRTEFQPPILCLCSQRRFALGNKGVIVQQLHYAGRFTLPRYNIAAPMTGSTFLFQADGGALVAKSTTCRHH